MTDHSPIPWRVTTLDEGDRYSSIIKTDKGTSIARIYGEDMGRDNADRIVAAVNACAELDHPGRVAELVERCRELLAEQGDDAPDYATYVLNFFYIGTHTPDDAGELAQGDEVVP